MKSSTSGDFWQSYRALSPEVQTAARKATMKRQAKTETELLDHATNNLLRAVKRKILKKEGRVDYDKLRRDGYSNHLLVRLEQA